jgi:hypothetical protein
MSPVDSYAVAVTPLAVENLAAAMFGGTLCLRANDRVYRIFKSQGDDVAFCDVDGELLAAVKFFPTEADARAWAERDAGQRALLMRAERVQ